MIRVEADGQPVELRTMIFSGGEVQPRLLDPPAVAASVKIIANVWSSDDLMELLLVTDACRQQWRRSAIHLVLPYLPYGRQDRACHQGEAFALKVVAQIIKDAGYASIEIWDPHSTVVHHLLIDAIFRRPLDFVRRIPTLTTDSTVIVAPDAGGHDRALKCADTLLCPLVAATKTRNPDTGELGQPSIDCGHIGSRDFLIVDDICDGGRTFVNLARLLRPLTDGRIYLYVTHGIFSAGYDRLRETLDHIYVANLHPHARPIPSFLTLLPTG